MDQEEKTATLFTQDKDGKISQREIKEEELGKIFPESPDSK